MSNLFVLKEQLQAFYARYSKEVDKIVHFLLAFIVFYLINSKIGTWKQFQILLLPDPGADLCVFAGNTDSPGGGCPDSDSYFCPVHGSDGSNGSTFCDYVHFLFPIYSGDVHDRAARYGSVSF